MIQVTFKNVGHGDSLILEWNYKGRDRICIIDCNLFQGGNPVLDYVIERGYKELDFLILSHPHFDHFSGFLQLLEYCKTNQIRVTNFIHTCAQVPSYLQAASRSAVTDRELQRLFTFLFYNYEEMNINIGAIQGDTPTSTIYLTDRFILKILSPTLSELNKYVRGSTYPFNEEEGCDNPKANFLSTIIKIECDQWYALLTSDADKSSLIRIDKRRAFELEKTLLLGQIPHHGASGNHNNAFWKKRNRINRAAMVASTGPNSFDHPSPLVISFFLDNDFSIFSTTGIVDSSIEDLINSLDVFSFHEPRQLLSLEGDQTFTLEYNEIDYKYS